MLNGVSQLEQSQFYVNDETDYCNDVNLPQKLLKLQLPHANEGIIMVSLCSQCFILFGCVGDSSDASDVIQSRLNSISHRSQRPSDAFTIIYESGLKQSLWQAQVEEAVESETDQFWIKVQKENWQT